MRSEGDEASEETGRRAGKKYEERRHQPAAEETVQKALARCCTCAAMG